VEFKSKDTNKPKDLNVKEELLGRHQQEGGGRAEKMRGANKIKELYVYIYEYVRMKPIILYNFFKWQKNLK
jgi:hypothetical protein